MKAIKKNELIRDRIARRLGVEIPLADVDTLRVAELTLSRWSERECGDANGCGLERDEETGIPYATYPTGRNGERGRLRTPDRETGALRRVAEVCARHGLSHYHQGDPRGCALYVGGADMTDENYSSKCVAIGGFSEPSHGAPRRKSSPGLCIRVANMMREVANA